MAKKLNKKVLYTLLIIGVLCLVGVIAFGGKYLRERSPKYCLKQARQLFEAGDFKAADRMFGKAYGRTKQDQGKIDILFEMAEFHLTPGEKHEPDWTKAMQCWNTVVNIDPQHIEARRKLLDFYYESAKSGNSGAWKMVEENTSKLIEIYQAASKAPDPYLLFAEAKAAIAIARLGNVGDRSEMLNRAIKTLEQLKKLTPEDAKIYSELANAAVLKGDMDEINGLIGSRDAAKKQAEQILTQAIAIVSDKAEAHANLFEMQLQQVQADPNAISALRKEGQKLIETYPDAPRLLSLLSLSYELRAKMDRKQEMDLAIQYSEKAISLPDGQKVANAIRLASLLYRAGDFYRENDQIQRAFDVAAQALNYSDATVLPGPKEASARQNRLFIRLFEARGYLDQTLQAREKSDTQSAMIYAEKLNSTVNDIVQFVGENHNLSRMWRGMQLLAEEKLDQAYVALYKVYQEMITQDKAGEPSNADSYLCYILSRFAARQGVVGLQREFLEKALFNRSGIAPDKPRAILDYAGVLVSIHIPQRAEEIVKSYVDTYGLDKMSGILLAQIYILSNQYDKAAEMLDKMDSSDPEVLSTRFRCTAAQVNFTAAQLAASVKGVSPASLQAIRDKRANLLNQMFDAAPEQIDAAALVSICVETANNGNAAQAMTWIDRFLAEHPDAVSVMLLKKELAEPDPKAITASRRMELNEQVLSEIKDPVQKLTTQARYYRSTGKIEEAKAVYAKLLEAAPDNPDAASDYFNFLLEQKDVKAAEEYFAKIRNKNPDGCEGLLFSAQLEMSKGNYTIALQRIDECLALRPMLTAAGILKSQIYQRLEKYTEAVDAASKTFQVDPRNPTAARQLASVLFDRNRQLGTRVTADQAAEAEHAVGIAMVLNPGDWQLQSVYAETVSEHNPEQGLAIRQSLLKKTPNVTNAAMLGNMALRLARDEKDAAKRDALIQMAQDAYERGWQIDSSDPLLRRAYAEFLRQTNQSQKAVEIFQDDPKMMWRYYLANGQYDKAKGILEQQHQANPEDGEILQALADACQGLSLWDQMKVYLDLMAQKKLSAEQQIWLIQRYLDGTMTDSAEKYLADFRSQYPTDNRAQILSSWLDMSRGQLESAMQKIDAFIEKDSTNSSAWRLKGRIYRLMNQPQQAIEALLRSKNIVFDSSIAIELAGLYSQNNQIEAAAGILSAAIEQPQSKPQLIMMLERLYQENNRTTELNQLYRRLLEKDPENAYWVTQYGMFCYGQKDYVNAIGLLEKAFMMTLKDGAGNPMAMDNYLGALIAVNKYDEAIAIASKYIDGPLSPVAYWNIAVVQAKQNQPQKAMDSFSKAIEKTADSPELLMPALSAMGRSMGSASVESWCNEKLAADSSFIPARLILASIAEHAGAYNKALEHIQLCLEKTPQNSPQALELSNRKANILTQAYIKTSDSSYLQQAVSQLEQSLKLQPNDPTMMNNLAFMLAENDLKLDEAKGYIHQAYLRAPGNEVVLDTYALVLYKTGDLTQAEKFINQTLLSYERSGKTPPWDVYKHQGMILQGLKKKKEAMAAFQKAMELGKDIPEKEKQFLNKSIESLK